MGQAELAGLLAIASVGLVAVLVPLGIQAMLDLLIRVLAAVVAAVV